MAVNEERTAVSLDRIQDWMINPIYAPIDQIRSTSNSPKIIQEHVCLISWQ